MTDLRALLADTRLSREARIMGIHIVSLGDGEHVVSHDEFRMLLGRGPRGGLAKDEDLAGYVQELRLHGYVDRREGGRGSPVYVTRPVLPPSQGVPEPDVSPPLGGGQSSPPPSRVGRDAFSPPPTGGQKPPSSSSTSTTSPSSSDARAREWVESRETLEGCRGALLDYLAERVAPDRQLAYAQTVAGIIEGTHENVWMARDGSHVREDRPQVVAGALNELRQSDEIGTYFRGPPGDVRNLESKIRYRVKAKTDAKRDADRNREASRAPGAARAEPSAGARATPAVHVER